MGDLIWQCESCCRGEVREVSTVVVISCCCLVKFGTTSYAHNWDPCHHYKGDSNYSLLETVYILKENSTAFMWKKTGNEIIIKSLTGILILHRILIVHQILIVHCKYTSMTFYHLYLYLYSGCNDHSCRSVELWKFLTFV